MKNCIAFVVVSLLAVAVAGAALPAQPFEPLRDTLARYNITGTPQASDYPDVPTVGILSVQEYRQLGRTHLRMSHEVLKILTAAGKSYTTVKVPCYAECRVEGRTIKPDGRLIYVPARDLVRNQQLTNYNAPYSLTQFAVPGVEPGDIVEIRTTVVVPSPLLLEDFRFPKTYPVLKSILILSHSAEDSYIYTLQGGSQIQVSKRTSAASGGEVKQTLFSMDNVPAAISEAYSAGAQQDRPGVRFLMTQRAGMQFQVFKDWFSYGKFISEGARLETLPPRAVDDFVKQAGSEATGDQEVVRLIYQAADRKILIGSETLIDAGFDFLPPEKVLERMVAQPHEFALFLAACFRVRKWSTELVLVNSHNLPETSKENPFPLDLDLVFVNVKTPSGEFLLDCNKNGIPFGTLSSSAMNRFALVIPIAMTATSIPVSSYLTTMPFRVGNANHIDMVWTPVSGFWNIDFRWFLGGELQAPFLNDFRQETEAEFLKEISFYVRSHLRADDIRELSYRWLAGGLELQGKARIPRTRIGAGCELIQNGLWDSGFNFRQYLFENRASSFLLPLAGEISSTVTIIVEAGAGPALPSNLALDFKPVRYVMSVERTAAQVKISETIAIADLLVRPSAFKGFMDFLDQYYAGHFWSIVLTVPGAGPAGPLP